jgi:hypothetical protein
MPNAIVTENQLAGNPKTEWDLSGPASTNIEGFATQISVQRGTTVSFKIKTAATSYRIDIYRLGYYGGNGARKVQTINKNAASPQPAPGGDATIGWRDCGNWAVSASWAIPAIAVSGVYIAKLTALTGVTGASHIPFVVRDDGAHHDVVFQTSDTTWHAYNGWGGANLYGGDATGTGDGRAYKVSYNRPIGTRNAVGLYAGPQDFVFSAEYPGIRWLERNGYDVGYIAGVDTGPGGAVLTNHKVFLSIGHDEYWSKDQRAHVEAARDAGTHLIFMSGNEVYWKTRWEPDINGVANRTMVCYKESRVGSKIDPSPEWTGTWRDPSATPPSDGGNPENSLTGTLFRIDSNQFDVLEIPYKYTQLRFWRNTGVASTASGGTATLNQGILGYEWDENPDNGFRPAGQILLSETTRELGQYLMDYGTVLGTDLWTATHGLSLYKASSGAIVFGTGTVYWSWGFDTVHDYTENDTSLHTAEDMNVQQATVNILADMGVQPQTLRTGLTAATATTDTTAPTTTITAPTGGASVVQQSAVTVTGTASDVGGKVAAVEVSTDGGQTWRLATGTTSWTYTWWPRLPGTYTVQARAVDDSLNMETPAAGVSVTVTPSATVRLFGPADRPAALGQSDPNPVNLGVKFTVNTPGSVTGIRYFKSPRSGGAHSAQLYSAAGVLLAKADFSGETTFGWQQANFTTPVVITPGSTYTAAYATPAYYVAEPNYFNGRTRTGGAVTATDGTFAYGSPETFPGESFHSQNYWVDPVFVRAGGAGNLAPTAHNDSGFTTHQDTALNIPAATLLANDTDPNGYPLTIASVATPSHGTVNYNAGTKVVTFTPDTGYTGAASFGYTIDNGHSGTSSATVSLTVTPAFTTLSVFGPSDTPAVLNAADAGAESIGVELGMKFKSSVAGQITGAKFYKGPQNTGTHLAHLWNTSGTLLATATYSGETASGWQSVTFPSPVSMAANTTYVISYHCFGHYSSTSNGFASARTNGALTGLSNASSGGNGVYSYGPGQYPDQTFGATNYFVDVIVQIPGA